MRIVRFRPAVAIFLLLAGAMAGVASAQSIRRAPDPFRVESASGTPYRNPFSGGLWQPRIGLRDVDADGRPDLFALNPDGELRMYRNLGGFAFQRILPSPYDSLTINNWFRFADLDGDGDAEILSAGPRSEVMVLDNLGSDASPNFAPIPRALMNANGDTIRTQRETVPSLVDIDNDGDLDLFAGNVDGSISFYSNIGTRAAPSFRFETSEYMGILVIAGGVARDPRDDDRSTLSSSRHGASVLDFADLDGDNDVDILFGDFFTKKLLHFTNTGTASSAVFSMSNLDTAFRPTGDDVESDGFNQPVTGDLDGDGDLDAIIATLLPTGSAQSITLYENEGTSTMQAMRRRSIDVTSEIDLGTYAAPAWITDASHDGLLVGATSGRITYIERSTVFGRTTFRVQATFVLPNLFQTVPTAGDLDGDGNAEVIVGEAFGGIIFHRFNGGALVRFGDTFQLNRNASPTLIDFDGDDDLDLFAGAENGRCYYFENQGTPTSPQFVRVATPEPFDTIDFGYDASPRFFDVDNDGDRDAMIGSRTGGAGSLRDTLRFFVRDSSGYHETDAFPPITSMRNPTALGVVLPEGRFLFVGDLSGGIKTFVIDVPGDAQSDALDDGIRMVQGDAGQRMITLAWTDPYPLDLRIYDMLGRLAHRSMHDAPGHTANVSLASLAGGVYLVAAGTGTRRTARTITIGR